jgi:hypothetical protein
MWTAVVLVNAKDLGFRECYLYEKIDGVRTL